MHYRLICNDIWVTFIRDYSNLYFETITGSVLSYVDGLSHSCRVREWLSYNIIAARATACLSTYLKSICLYSTMTPLERISRIKPIYGCSLLISAF